jgi:NAD(P)-dependent dehydrogenase (short-subunit alcohol dehydrogenase family)
MPLEGKTAVVTGAARGIGRGIALVLGEAGVTVYLTDRETRRRKRSPLPGTVEDTAEQGGLDLLVANAFGGDPDTIALHVYYDLAMHATSRLAFGLAQDLRSHGVTALAISPGFTRTEAITAQLGDLPPGSDSIEFPGGRCVPCGTTRTWPAMPATPSRRRSGQRIRVQRSRGCSRGRGPVAAGGMGRRRETHRKDTLP